MGMVTVAENNQRCGIRCGLRSKRKLHFSSLYSQKNATLVMSTAVIVPMCIHKNLYQFQFFLLFIHCHIQNKRDIKPLQSPSLPFAIGNNNC